MQSFIKVASALIFLVIFGTVSAQVIPAPTINCVSVNQNNGDVDISFTPAALDPCGAFTDYKIYGTTDTVNGPILLVGTITNPNQHTYTHTGASGTIVNWYYYIVMEQGCPGSTSQITYFTGGQLLQIPTFTYVTVTAAGIQINWAAITSPAVDSVIIYYIDPVSTLAQPMDTLYRNVTTYVDANPAHITTPVQYTIQAKDACGTQTIQQPLEHNNMFMDVVSNACLQKATISWNAYHNWQGDSAHYTLETIIDGGAPTLTGLGDPVPTGTPITVRQSADFSIKGLTGNNICFRIIAEDPTRQYTSATNQICLPLQVLRSTAFNIGSWGSVVDTNVIGFSFFIDPAAQIASFVVKRGLDGSHFAVTDSFGANGNNQFEVTYYDSSVNTSSSSYYYEVDSKDSCGYKLTSTYARTIFLSVTSPSGNVNDLSWNPFELSGASVLNYTIYRIRKDGTSIALAILLPDVLTYEDVVGDAVSNDGTFCYRIVAKYVLNVPSLSVSKTYTTTSNDVCVSKDPVIYIPTAFAPGGINKSFRPVLLFGVNQYDFKIFDRWGKQLFSTQDVVSGWDGTYKGEKMPLGGYIYQLKVTSVTGETMERQGVVALIR